MDSNIGVTLLSELVNSLAKGLKEVRDSLRIAGRKRKPKDWDSKVRNRKRMNALGDLKN